MVASFTARQELQARRLIAQGLAQSAARPELESPKSVIEHLLALQGQTYKAGIRAIAQRINNGSDFAENPEQTVAEVLKSVENHEIVRAWPMRGTLHFLAATEARWLMRLCSPRVENAAAKRRAGLGIDPESLVSATSSLEEYLLNLPVGEVLPRAQAYELFAEAGLNPKEGRGPHLLRAVGGFGDIVQSVPAGRYETFVHVDRLRVEQRYVAENDALAELATRYLNGHGPVLVEDLSWWAYLTKRDCKKALETARNSQKMKIGETEYFVPAWQLDVTEAELTDALDRSYELPAFDEYLLGYADKSFTMPDEIRHEVLTKNGISWDFTVQAGEVVGRTH
ncbi:DNA glycosylase AlkZ-like family protein [Rothia aerolata]|uniref:Winged helix DNA-binding domain-containing protein n=1 Tax=Rothia aerolata TaxID=1812262 RepID=A0A917IVA3_9MICC|nr:crosslink repair DNA glycosylase YcaQ family protein [Rothia aerolata]GGH63626.1 hypothetical protein GCM10007359_15130 [Rothia aerolata]